uniref:Uncharacterized protein n=1 Tax=Zea mays TaxID=4577 RepID=A0A804NIL1_MAIZE
MHRVAVDAVGPGPAGVGRRLDALQCHTAALESGAEGDHPHPIARPHPGLGLDVGQLVQHQAAGRVPEPVQRHPRRLHVLVGQAEPALHLVDHRAAAGVDAEVLKRLAEVRAVQPHPGAPAAHELALEQRHRHQELLRDRQHEGAERRDVPLERMAGRCGEVLGEANAQDALAVFLLEYAAVVGVPRGGHGADEAAEPEPRALGAVGEDRGGGPHAEEAVGQQHRALAPDVVLRREDLRGHRQDARAWRRHLEEVLGQADGDEPRAAAHPGQVQALHVGAEPVPVDDHVGEDRRGREDAAVDDEHVDLLGPHARPGEHLVHCGEDDQLGLLPGRLEAAVRRHVVVGVGQARLVAEPRALEQADGEADALVVHQVRQEVHVLQARGERRPEARPRSEAAVLHQVHVPRPAQAPQLRHAGSQDDRHEHVDRPRGAKAADDIVHAECWPRPPERGGYDRCHRDHGEESVHEGRVPRLEKLGHCCLPGARLWRTKSGSVCVVMFKW